MSQKPTNPRLVESVVKTLREAELGKINFECRGSPVSGKPIDFIVTGMRYSVVADLVEKGRIVCNLLGRSASHGLPAGNVAAAAYVPSAGDRQGNFPDQFLFPTPSFGEDSGYQKSVIVHEATHAMHDVFLARNCLAVEDEATAWLAQAFYMRFTPHRTGGGGLLIDGPLDMALRLADQLIAAGFGGRTQLLPAPDMRLLQQAIAREYGFTGGGAGIQSVYDGVP